MGFNFFSIMNFIPMHQVASTIGDKDQKRKLKLNK